VVAFRPPSGEGGRLGRKKRLRVERLAAVITAGGRVAGGFAEEIGTDIKALAPIGGRRLIDASIDAARAAGATRIVVVGAAAVHAYCGTRVDEAIDESPSGEENLRRALASARGAPLLLLTSDLPFASPAALSDFLARVQDADIAMPLASETAYNASFPGAPDHVVVLAGERVANGSAFWFAPGTALQVSALATRLFTARKSLVAMALLLGPALLARFVTRRLAIADIEDRAQRVFGLRVRAVRDALPSLCYDVDTQADYQYALERIGRG
jgi:GTP:adenosylcobinamide-phosphate guanylyltransferase